MVDQSILVPCTVLGGICAGMLIFIWWWYPRTWNKGNNQEAEVIGLEVDVGSDIEGLSQEEKMRLAGQRARDYLRAVEARNKAKAEGLDIAEPLPVYQGLSKAHQR